MPDSAHAQSRFSATGSLGRIANICREHARLLPGFTCLFLWTWIMLQNSFFYMDAQSSWSGGGDPWTLATVVFAVTFAAIGVVSHWFDYSLLDPRVLLGVLAFLVGGGVIAWLSFNPSLPERVQNGLIVTAALIMGLATPVYYMEMVRQFLPLRLTHIIVVCSVCTIFASVAYVLLTLLPEPISSFLPVLLPAGVFYTLWHARRATRFTPRRTSTAPYIPWKLNLTAFAQGVGYKAGFALCVQLNGTGGTEHIFVYIAGYAAAAFVLAISAALLHRRFDTLIYKIGFPALAIGTLLVPAASGLGISCFLAAWGYRFIDILIWSLVPYLAVSKHVTINWMTGWSTCFFYLGMAFGHTFTEGAIDIFGVESGQLIMSLAACFVLIVGLAITSTSNDERAWGALRPDGEGHRPFFDEAVASLGARYGLTARQTIILALLSSGKTKAEIANELGISRETVKVHTRNVYAALDVHAQDELTTLVATEQRALEERIE